MKWYQIQREKAARHIMDELRDRCCPLLVGYGGGIAFGLDTPGSDIVIRGICTDPIEERIDRKAVQEPLRLAQGDTVLYGLHSAAALLMEADPAAIMLMGLQPEQYLYCGEAGHLLLENATIFLSRRVYDSFWRSAFQLLRKLQAAVLKGSTDPKRLSREMAYLIALYSMGIDLLINGKIVTRRDEHKLLMEIHTGAYLGKNRVPTAEYERLLEYYMGSLRDAVIRTHLPSEPDTKKANALMMEIAGRLPV